MDLQSIFREFAKVVKRNPNIVISLFDTNGKLVESSDQDNPNHDISVFSKNDSQVAIYKIQLLDEFVGYLVIQTKTAYEYLDEIGAVLFETFKTRIELELEKQQRDTVLSTSEKLVDSIIFKENINKSRQLMQDLALKMTAYRIPIILVNKNPFSEDILINLKYRLNDNQTFYSKINANTMVIFLHISSYEFDDYESYITNWIKKLKEWGLDGADFYAGQLTNSIMNYSHCYKEALWIRDSIPIHNKNILFFKDYYLVYLLSMDKTVQQTFDNYRDLLVQKDIDLEQTYQIIQGLIENDFNLTKTARKLYIHKNTLLYRINKLEKEIFGFDIKNNFHNKLFITAFMCYIKYIGLGK